jgi:hypothetical protein
LHLAHVVFEPIAVSGVSITAIQDLITRLLVSGSLATRLHHDLMIATSFDRTTHRYTVASICCSIATRARAAKILTTPTIAGFTDTRPQEIFTQIFDFPHLR